MKRGWVVFVLILMLAVPFVMAQLPAPTSPTSTGSGMSGILSGIGQKILMVGNPTALGLTGNTLIWFTRILFGLVTFILFFAVITGLGGKDGKAPMMFFSRSHATLISLALTIISMYFMPDPVVLAAGTGWTTAIAFLLVGAPIVGLFMLAWKYPADKKDETRGTVFMKIVLCFLLLWILTAMANVLLGSPSTGVAFASPLVGSLAEFIYYSEAIVVIAIIWYILKLFVVEGPDKATRDAELAKRQEGVAKWFETQSEKKKHAKEHAEHQVHEEHERHEKEHAEHKKHEEHEKHKKHKTHEAAGVLGHLVNAQKSMDEALQMLHLVAQDNQGHHKQQLQTHFKQFLHDFDQAWRQMRTMPSKFHAHPQDRAELSHMLAELEAVRVYFLDHIHHHKIEGTPDEISAQLKVLRDHINKARAGIHAFFDKIQDFTRK
ncbi:hypothetical protein HYV86_04890 [Candidatus Woesearchaeota archaeon]|nr:hypothetical protein [Candidatus Woesearchaeota archaeon]